MLAGRGGLAPCVVIVRAKKAKMARVIMFLKFILVRGGGGRKVSERCVNGESRRALRILII